MPPSAASVWLTIVYIMCHPPCGGCAGYRQASGPTAQAPFSVSSSIIDHLCYIMLCMCRLGTGQWADSTGVGAAAGVAGRPVPVKSCR